ncbi:MAG: NUDIX domain-containing protein [Armatimonadota bacterium]|nr:NUDIX domain-containing protein [Armatimonadota bacterium]MDR7484734.1 NUDIX domain-containing protein [Armatimonadota bacterium]MDR7531849.1 NUDIX domain-containing protein [Armatimonadota bacterium]MDR7534806.1 NUDIX domain-containing protein [Armatimonadota bacterium]
MGLFTPRPDPEGPAAVYLRTLIFVFHGERVLLMQRAGGPEAGWWNGLGGKLDRGEDPLEAARRELSEEAGIVPPLVFRGVASVIVRATGAHWVIFLFAARAEGETVVASPEGVLRWVAPDDLATLRLFPDVTLLLPCVRPEVGGVVLAKVVYATADLASFDPSATRIVTF